MKITKTNKLLNYSDFIAYSSLYIETGSCSGESIQRALDAGFLEVKSVEAMLEYFDVCTHRFAGNNRVDLYLGSSYKRLPNMLKDVDFSAVIFLDAHPAGPGTAGHDEIMEGQQEFGQDYIITKELEVILSHRNDHLIIIDDLSIGSDEDAKYMQMCLDANPNYLFEYYDENIGQYRQNKILVCRP